MPKKKSAAKKRREEQRKSSVAIQTRKVEGKSPKKGVDPRLDRMYVKNVRCLYCKAVIAKYTMKCEQCGITKEQIAGASNQEALKIKKEGLPGKVVFTTQKPNDLRFGKFVALMVFLGIFGAHNFFVGRRIKGWIMFVGMMVCILGFIIFPIPQDGGVATGMASVRGIFDSGARFPLPFPTDLLGGIIIIMWIVDWFAAVVFSRYKYPVRICPN